MNIAWKEIKNRGPSGDLGEEFHSRASHSPQSGQTSHQSQKNPDIRYKRTRLGPGQIAPPGASLTRTWMT